MVTETAARGITQAHSDGSASEAPKRNLQILGALVPALLLVTLLTPRTASAGRASTGALVFYPCTRCHPTGANPASSRPNGFKGHRIKLEVHDVLGKGKTACLVCHSSRNANPGKLKLIDGGLVDIKGNTSLVCFRCHEDKYNAWRAGFHGKKPSCSAMGCHNPHAPSWIGISPLLPYVGTTIEIKAVGERERFAALPGPPPIPDPPVFLSMNVLSLLGLLGIAGVWALPILRRRRHHGQL